MAREAEEAGARTMWPSADPGDAGHVRLPFTETGQIDWAALLAPAGVEGGAEPAQEAVLPVPPVEDASHVTRRDVQMHPTAICAHPGCGHVRWRHGPYPDNPCKVPGCICLRGWEFYVAEYFGNPETGRTKQ